MQCSKLRATSWWKNGYSGPTLAPGAWRWVDTWSLLRVKQKTRSSLIRLNVSGSKLNWPVVGDMCSKILFPSQHLPSNDYLVNKTYCTNNLPPWFAHFSGRNLGSIWLDATDSETEGTFRWMTTNEVLTYTNRYPGEPNDRGDEDCIMIYFYNAKWNDASCRAYGTPVCEIEY